MTLICQFCQCLRRGDWDFSASESRPREKAVIETNSACRYVNRNDLERLPCFDSSARDNIAAPRKRSKTGGKISLSFLAG